MVSQIFSTTFLLLRFGTLLGKPGDILSHTQMALTYTKLKTLKGSCVLKRSSSPIAASARMI
ncbi:MAG: hypothetical protein BJ554DRAFT_5284, partial [Olpidium bornovanus]